MGHGSGPWSTGRPVIVANVDQGPPRGLDQIEVLWVNAGGTHVPEQCSRQRQVATGGVPPEQPERDRAASSDRPRHSRSPTLNPRVRGSSPWRRTTSQQAI
jgi:hypothetical protein